MKSMTIKQAKARLNELVDAAERGEDVVLLRGSRHVAAIVPITEDDLELASRLSDDQARRLWKTLADDAPSSKRFPDMSSAVKHLQAPAAAKRKRTARRPR